VARRCLDAGEHQLRLFLIRDASWGLVWAAQIQPDPFDNIATYWQSPLALLRDELLDPLDFAHHRHGA
jgi:hypothetical protein